MKKHIIFITAAAVLLSLAIGLRRVTYRTHSRFNQANPTQTFQVHGQIRGLDIAARTVRIAHEEIPNYMPAMTMPLSVKDPALLHGLAAGDNVQFELEVTGDDSWISHIEKTQAETAVSTTAGPAAPSLETLEAERVQAGEPVPDFGLIGQDGRPVRLSDFRGKAVVLTFIYTRCPLPNFCPLMSKNFSELQQRLSKEFPNRFHLLSISMDPDFDRPAVLKEYATRFEADPQQWTFATGDDASINFVAGLLGLYFEKQNGLISHDLRTALIGPDGRLVHLWKSNVWTPYEIQRRLRETLTGARDVAAW